MFAFCAYAPRSICRQQSSHAGYVQHDPIALGCGGGKESIQFELTEASSHTICQNIGQRARIGFTDFSYPPRTPPTVYHDMSVLDRSSHNALLK